MRSIGAAVGSIIAKVMARHSTSVSVTGTPSGPHSAAHNDPPVCASAPPSTLHPNALDTMMQPIATARGRAASHPRRAADGGKWVKASSVMIPAHLRTVSDEMQPAKPVPVRAVPCYPTGS